MRKQFILFIFFFVILFCSQTLLSQDSLRIEIKNGKIKYKSLSLHPLSGNRLTVSIKDFYGEEITGLTKNDFSIFKKEKPALILNVVPLSQSVNLKQRVVLVLDNSASMAPFSKDLEAIIDELTINLSASFYTSIVAFDESLDHTSYKANKYIGRLNFTKSISELRDYCSSALRARSQRTYLNDAIMTAIEAIRNDTLQHVENNFIVILSDGNDIGSEFTESDIQNTDKSKILFYSIDFMHSSRESRHKNIFLQKLAKESGGEYFSPKDINALRTNFKSISSGIRNLGYEVEYEQNIVKPSILFDLNTNEFAQRPEPYRSFQGMLMEDMKMNESFPLLNYIFFETNSSNIPSRYKFFPDSNSVKYFSENKIEGDAIQHYYHILNIYGKRLKDFPSSAITIIGNTDGTENNWEILSAERAKTVKNYFTEIWGIDPSRIQTVSGKYPGKPSSSKIEDGRAENRRVEFYSSNWEIMKPITFIQDTINITPRLLNFRFSIPEPASVKKMILNITNNDLIWNSFYFTSKFNSPIQYNWRNKDNLLPRNLTKLDFRLTAYDERGDSSISNTFSLPVKEITSAMIKAEKLFEKKLRKVSLILFDYDSYNPGENNETIMKHYVYRILSDTSQYITVNGYTDIIGKPAYNLRLSQNRAEKISNLLRTKYSPKRIKYRGLGSGNPVYSNNLPEGRFYNRTVQILFQNYKPD